MKRSGNDFTVSGPFLIGIASVNALFCLQYASKTSFYHLENFLSTSKVKSASQCGIPSRQAVADSGSAGGRDVRRPGLTPLLPGGAFLDAVVVDLGCCLAHVRLQGAEPP